MQRRTLEIPVKKKKSSAAQKKHTQEGTADTPVMSESEHSQSESRPHEQYHQTGEQTTTKGAGQKEQMQQVVTQFGNLGLSCKTPFAPSTLAAPGAQKVKLPNIDTFDGTMDPDDHLAAFKRAMYLQGADDATWCKHFPATLKGVAQKWFNSLPDHSIKNLMELSIIFSHHFMANKQEKKTSMHLGKIVFANKETLRSYVQRFNLEALHCRFPT